ncbi:MAG: YggT family protein [Deltaproteobacteria bacterium]|nr:YggT family protein [Deltaproteobacteria bacterium]
MFVIGNFLQALARIIDLVLTLYMWIIVIRALISWVNPDPYNQIVQFLYRITEPVLYYVRYYIRRIFPPLGGMGIDISPVIVILVIIFLQNFLVRTLMQLSVTLQ